MKAEVRAEHERRFEAQARRWYRLTCPVCAQSVDVAHERTRAWCTKHPPTRVEMEGDRRDRRSRRPFLLGATLREPVAARVCVSPDFAMEG